MAWPSSPDFQLLVLAQLAEVMLLASPVYQQESALPLYIEAGLAWQTPTFGTDDVRIYVSPHNVHASPIVDALCDAIPDVQVVHVRNHGRRSGVKWLLVLTPTAFDGEAGERLAFECEAALKAGVQPLLVYCPEEHTFGEIVEAMPRGMVSAGIYGPRTVEWRGNDLKTVSIRLIARALGATMRRGASVGGRGCCPALLGRWLPGAVPASDGLKRLDDSQNARLAIRLSSFRMRRPSAMQTGDEVAAAGVQLQPSGASRSSGVSGKY